MTAPAFGASLSKIEYIISGGCKNTGMQNLWCVNLTKGLKYEKQESKTRIYTD